MNKILLGVLVFVGLAAVSIGALYIFGLIKMSAAMESVGESFLKQFGDKKETKGQTGAFRIALSLTPKGSSEVNGVFTVKRTRDVKYTASGLGQIKISVSVRGGKVTEVKVLEGTEVYCLNSSDPWELQWTEKGVCLLMLDGGSNLTSWVLETTAATGNSLDIAFNKQNDKTVLAKWASEQIGTSAHVVSLDKYFHDKKFGIPSSVQALYGGSACA